MGRRGSTGPVDRNGRTGHPGTLASGEVAYPCPSPDQYRWFRLIATRAALVLQEVERMLRRRGVDDDQVVVPAFPHLVDLLHGRVLDATGEGVGDVLVDRVLENALTCLRALGEALTDGSLFVVSASFGAAGEPAGAVVQCAVTDQARAPPA